MRLKKIELATVLALIICMVLNITIFFASCENIRHDVLRLHILANSDTAADQALKLRVRDRLLSEGYDIFDGAHSLMEAKATAVKNFAGIKKICQEEVKAQGYNYTVNVSLEKAFFETRYYEDFTLPAGNYDALRVVIGKGEGHNWWFVVFPALCTSAASDKTVSEYLDDEELALIEADRRFEIRFKCVEWIENIKNLTKK